MGREKLIKNLNKIGNTFIGLGIFVGLISLFMTLIFITDGFSIPLLIFLGLLVLAIILIVKGVDNKKGENSKFVKKYPNVLELADSLDNPVFENDFIIISDKAIADKKKYCNIVALNDVLAIYEHITRTNGIVTAHTIQLSSIDGRDIQINVYARKRDTKDDLLLTISNYCPNAKVGFTPETMAYVNEKRKNKQ
ncbi:MAG: hypothetical protein J6K42_00505 [Clostridia bacterium]|nr:hypothetical protein [Clostridia bacterium]